MSGSRKVLRRSVLAAAIILAACGGGKDKSSHAPEVENVDAEDLTIDVAPPVTTAGTEISSSEDGNFAGAGFSPETILGETAPLLAIGTEPYWTAEIGEGWIVFDRPGLPLVEVPLPEFKDTGGAISLQSEGISMTLTPGGCDEGQGSISVVVAYEAVETEGGNEGINYIGCAGAAGGAQALDGGDSSWKDLIEPSQTAINACLTTAVEDRLILALYPREPGTVGMILGDKLGGYEECGADTETGEVYFFDPMSADQAEDWMTGAAFLPEGANFKCADGEDFAGGIFLPNGCRR